MALALLSQKWPLLKIEDELSSTSLWYGVTRLICYCFFPYTPNVMDVTSLSKANHAGGPLDAMPSGALCSNTATNGSNVNAPMLTSCSVGKDLHLNCTTNIYGHVPGGEMIDQQVPVYDQSKEKQNILHIRDEIKKRQKIKSETILEGIETQSTSVLNKVYTELYIVTCDSTSINKEHEVWQAETAHLKDYSEASVIKFQDLFKPAEDETIRCVMTKGIAGIGKTVAAQKLNLDWANGKENQDLDFLFLLSFRKLNLRKGPYSLHELLQLFYPQLKDINVRKMYDEHKVLFILDGLDESQLPLEFGEIENRLISDVSESASLDVLLTNLITGRLLPGALLWITSRPVAANQIPREYCHRVTEIRGFNDAQKDEYFRKHIRDPEMASRIISDIKATRSLYIMCHVPVFCWMAVTVLQDILSKDSKSGSKPRSLPTTLSEMYMHYIKIQTSISFEKHGPTPGKQLSLMSNKDDIVKLGKLAYQNLDNQNVLFTEQDLTNCGISVMEAATCPGLCTELVELENGLYPKKVYCFVHLSVQEFFAALYAFHEFENGRIDSVKAFIKKRKGGTLLDFLKGALDRALDSKNGHLDLFTRFLFGISHDSSRAIVHDILGKTTSGSECNKKLIGYIKMLKRKDLSPERCINLIHCLLQLKDHTVLQNDNNNQVSPSDTQPTPFQCSLLAYMFIMSEKPEEFDFRNNKTTEEAFRRLTPALLSCTRALLNFCDITTLQCATVASVLQSENSRLTVLDLGHNNLGDEGVIRLCCGLRNPNCKVETLNLRHNHVGHRGVNELCKVLTVSTSKLLTLDLSCNDLTDLGVAFLACACCKLQTLRLSGCLITKKGSSFLALVLRSNPFQMKELDLSYNPLGDLVDFPSELEKLEVDYREENRRKQGLRKYISDASELTLDPSTANGFLSLSEGNRKVTRQKKEQKNYPSTHERFDKCNQVLCKEGLCGRHYLEVECLHDVHIGMAYKRLERKGAGDNVTLGQNAVSWTLYASKDKFHAQHKKIIHNLRLPEIKSNESYRIGVLLDWPAGILSFYNISSESDKLTHLYAFHTTFTEPLYLGLRLQSPTSTISLIVK
ncbi:NACHT, LRR and PYD domains-containing protein 3 isoform X3 [Oncorhynchus kisutch]|uniref:NACHT, LRR and PYD domains-containing protein 3 n=1 Tax=Oncorhynchus kisutch TaxID=8019 RepID=A0A8C7JAA3_ONCKI|nr:NACHT, LRR and PYD domains-containing protein 3 isoform X3 [Oncorhynchus kisutch]XP_031669762.1 NACHT, LRR and PYD domains-containing protein 3 isoform X3 [Oncorhynchus kisutch]XP_031669763.1 NACHT, LRR and PYD domains-containing protein 3 isoform X3 [Oncorhynchus kisutch]